MSLLSCKRSVFGAASPSGLRTIGRRFAPMSAEGKSTMPIRWLPITRNKRSSRSGSMRTIAKLFLAPIWLILVLLNLLCNVARGLATVILSVVGSFLLMVGVVFLMMGDASRQQAVQALIGCGACFVFPFILVAVSGIVDAAHTLIADFITD